MIGLQDRQQLARDIQIAHDSGARLHLACQVAGIDVRTLQPTRLRVGWPRAMHGLRRCAPRQAMP